MDRYAVIGNPVTHSKSPLIHAAFAEQCQQEMNYGKIEGRIDHFEEDVRDFFAEPENKGMNVTVPFKEQAFALCEHLSERATMAEAVNTLWMQNGMLHGDNTDGCGLITDLQHNYQIELRDKRILVLGAGGAVKGVLLPLLQASPKEIVVANRTLAKAQSLVGRYNDMASMRACAFGALSEAFDLVINGTSASLSGTLPEISSEIIGSNTDVYDMMYSDGMTVFNRWAHEQGARTTMDGLGMLVEQAAEAFYIWRGIKPKTTDCIASLRRR